MWYVGLSLTEAQFAALRPTVTAPSTVIVPPVWPGADYVTLGEPVAIGRGVTVPGPLHGVVVMLTAVDPKQMYYTYNDLTVYRHIGALIFVNDDGAAEGWQALGPTSAIYCPRTMSVAGSVKVMTPVGTTGTITPWTINAP